MKNELEINVLLFIAFQYLGYTHIESKFILSPLLILLYRFVHIRDDQHDFLMTSASLRRKVNNSYFSSIFRRRLTC